MALNWNWSEKCGELTIVNYTGGEQTISLYQGNAYLIMINEFKNEEGEEFYNVYGFFNGKEHMLRCLGQSLHYDSDNIYEGAWKKIRLNKAKFRHTKEFVKAIAGAFDNIAIELYTE